MHRRLVVSLALLGAFLCSSSPAVWSLRQDVWELPLHRVTVEGWRTLGFWPDSGIDYFEVTFASRAERDLVRRTLAIFMQLKSRMRPDPSIVANPRFDEGRYRHVGPELWVARAATVDQITLVDWKGNAYPLRKVVETLHGDRSELCAAVLFGR